MITELGGAVAVPNAVRSSDSTTTMRVNDVIMQLSAPFLVFGLVFNIGLGILARLMPQMQVYFVGVPLSILAGFLIFGLVITALMGAFLDYFIGVMQQLTPVR